MNRLNLGLRWSRRPPRECGLLATTAAPASAAPFANGLRSEADRRVLEVRGPGDTLGGGWIVQPAAPSTWSRATGRTTPTACRASTSTATARGKICQTFDTGAGQDVSIRFSMSRNFNDFSRRGMNSLLATVNGAPLGDDGVFTHDLPVSQIEMNWVEHVESFTGSGSDTVCFESLSQADQARQGTGPALDHVVLNSPPEVEIRRRQTTRPTSRASRPSQASRAATLTGPVHPAGSSAVSTMTATRAARRSTPPPSGCSRSTPRRPTAPATPIPIRALPRRAARRLLPGENRSAPRLPIGNGTRRPRHACPRPRSRSTSSRRSRHRTPSSRSSWPPSGPRPSWHRPT